MNEQTEISAVDKLRNIVNWYGWQNENFAQRFKTVLQLEQVYDFAKNNDFEFLDDLREYDADEKDKIKIFFENLK